MEQDRAAEAQLEGKKDTHILEKPYRWETWAAPKDKSGQAVRQAIHGSASGTKVRHTSPTKIGAGVVRFPPVAEQERIVAQLDALSAETQRLTRLYGQKQAALAALKKSLLHQAFAGEL